MRVMLTALLMIPVLSLTASASGNDDEVNVAKNPIQFSRYGQGEGPRLGEDGVFHLLDAEGTQNQANTIGFDNPVTDLHMWVDLLFKLRVLEGAEGGFLALLDTETYGSTGPAPFLPKLEAPSFENSFAVGIDVSNPPNEDMFRGPGNIFGHPEREVSLHWDGREIVKRRAEEEFRGEEFVDWNVSVQYVIGGAEVTVRFGRYKIYDRYFIPGMRPYRYRLAMGARTGEAATEFDVKDPREIVTDKAEPAPEPLGFNIFNYVQTTRDQGTFTSEVDLPPMDWAFGRIIMKIRIHGGSRWDEWDRIAHVSVKNGEGNTLEVVRFITSYKTPCYWEVDVTDFRSLLAGKTEFVIHAGTIYNDKGFLMSVDLDYYPGRPERLAYEVVPLWRGTVKYQSDDDPFCGFYEDRNVDIGRQAIAARLHLVHTGHSQVGEFTPAPRKVICNDAVFENVLWRDDCYLNPNRPQFGTWKFPRAGWAPGDVCHPWLIDVSASVIPGKPALIRYEPQKYEFPDATKIPGAKALATASHSVASYLILYTDPAGLLDAPSVLIHKVSPGTAAKEAGLQRGDYLFSYDGVRLYSVDDVDRAKKAAEAAGKTSVKLVYYRGSDRVEIDFPTGQMGVSLGGR